MSPVLYPDLRPTISNVQVLVTAKWGSSGYRPVAIPSVEQYYVDTALDNDADTWSVDIGDPTGELIDIFDRNNEIRVQLFGVGSEGDGATVATGKQSSWGKAGLLTGVTDEISYDEEGTITLTGRDLSSLATDSTVKPQRWQAAKAWSIIGQQAKDIGFNKTNLAKGKIVKKLQYTDGSETYWEFWYRLYRKEKMWIWCEPDGTLTAQALNYTADRSYYLGQFADNDTQYIKRIYIPVEHAEIKKTTQSRVYEVMVLGHKGDTGFIETQQDPTIKDWLKRPRKIVEDAEAHTSKAARKTAWEEIFEGKVGSLELKLTIPDPGFIVRQNRIAHVRLPNMGIEGDWFVVGSRIQGGPQGFAQEVRLREKLYALTRRIPTDPKAHKTNVSSKDVLTELGNEISGLDSMPEDWGTYFVNAAKEFHGPWDYSLFLACLLGICDQETHFQNIRQHLSGLPDNGEWHPPPSAVAPPDKGDTTIVQGVPGISPGLKRPPTKGNPLETWKMYFANEPNDGYCNRDNVGVGPMQLTSQNLKWNADDHFKPGHRDNFTGGRWHPEHNIWAAASAFRSMLKEISADSGQDNQIWMGVMAYNRGVAGARSYWNSNNALSAYAQGVKSNVINNYLPGVKSALDNARQAAKQAQDDSATSPLISEDDLGPSGYLLTLTRNKIIVKFNEAVNPFFPATANLATSRREAVVMAAMWGYYNRDAISYTQSSQREKDFGPPPNVPAATDCSAFAEWCYLSAKAPNPGHTTYDQRKHGRAISYAQLRPGDLVFYENPDHVGVYGGDGKVIEHGSQAGPIISAANYRPIVEMRTYPMTS